MGITIKIANRDKASLNYMLNLWEGSVRATHTFLNEQDIAALKPDVMQALKSVHQLFCSINNTIIDGFIGVENQKIEMLFIDVYARGKGIGKQLATYALKELGALYVDVNAQNIQGVSFYEHIGFHFIARSEIDDQGRPFPILHMKI